MDQLEATFAGLAAIELVSPSKTKWPAGSNRLAIFFFYYAPPSDARCCSWRDAAKFSRARFSVSGSAQQGGATIQDDVHRHID